MSAARSKQSAKSHEVQSHLGDTTPPAAKVLKKRHAEGVVESDAANLSVSKQRRLERKAKKLASDPASQFIFDCNALYSQLIAKGDREIRPEKVQACLDLIENFDVCTPDAFAAKARLNAVNRCLQLCLKFGNAEQRNFVISRLTPHFVDISGNDKGNHLAKKMVRYSSSTQRDELAATLLAAPKSSFFFNRFAASIVELFCELEPPFDGEKFRSEVLRRIAVPNTLRLQLGDKVDSMSLEKIFHGVDARGKKQMHDRFMEVATKFADKSLVDKSQVHSLLSVATSLCGDDEQLLTQYQTVMEGKEAPLLQTLAGTIALCRLIHVMTAKARRGLLQTLKNAGVSVRDFVTNPVSSSAFLKLIAVVDDTQLLKKQLLAPAFSVSAKTGRIVAMEDFREVCFAVPAQRVLLYLIAGANPRWMPPKVVEMCNQTPSTSKKDPIVRRKECLELLWSPLCTLLESDFSQADTLARWLMDRHARDLVWAVLVTSHTIDASDTILPDPEAKAAESIVAALYKQIENMLESGRAEEELFNDSTASSTLTSFIRIAPTVFENIKAKRAQTAAAVQKMRYLQLPDGELFAEKLFNLLHAHLSLALRSRAVFLLIDTAQIVFRLSKADLAQFKRNCKDALSQAPELSELPGVQLLKKKFLEA